MYVYYQVTIKYSINSSIATTLVVYIEASAGKSS